MKTKIWYEVNPRSDKWDLSFNKGSPNAYLSKEEHATEYRKNWPSTGEITETENPKHLRYGVIKKGEIVASFAFPKHAQRYLSRQLHFCNN